MMEYSYDTKQSGSHGALDEVNTKGANESLKVGPVSFALSDNVRLEGEM